MSIDQLKGVERNKMASELRHRHFAQIHDRTNDHHVDLQSVFAVTFRPGNWSGSFNGSLLCTVGCAPLIVLSYENIDERNHKRAPFRAFGLDVDMDGNATYGVHASDKFYYDAATAFRIGARGRQIDPLRSPGLAELLLRMDRACTKKLGHLNLPVIPQFPKLLLGFAPNALPKFEDTPALRRLAAKQIGVSRDRLGANGDLLLERLLHDVWEQHVVATDRPDNSTGLVLIDAELCTQVRLALRMFEDFSELSGDNTWNPSREVKPLQVVNPSSAVLSEFYIDASQDFSQHIPAEIVDRMVARMREVLEGQSSQFADDEIMDGLVCPSEPLTAWTAALPRLRAKLAPAIAEATTDDDLLKAAKQPAEPLFASGLAKIQVLRRRAMGSSWDLFFSPDDLRRRFAADLTPHAAIATCKSASTDAKLRLPVLSQYSAIAALHPWQKSQVQ